MALGSVIISVPTSDGEFNAYLSLPEVPNGVAIVVLQEIFGVNANIREIADRFASEGFVAVAPDLYWRQEAGVDLDPASEQDRARAMGLMKGLDRNEAVVDAIAALAAARERSGTVRVAAAVGYCFGGGVAYLLASRGAVELGVSYYGTGLHDLLDEAEGAKGKLLVHIAGNDHLCPPSAQEKIIAGLAPLGDRVRVTVYEGVGHAFARKGGQTFDADAASAANDATDAALNALAGK